MIDRNRVRAAGAAYADQDLSVKVWFPDNPTGEFVPGKVSKAVFGLHNVDDTACNVSYAGASLALPYDASSSIFNFSSVVGWHVPRGGTLGWGSRARQPWVLVTGPGCALKACACRRR